MATPGPQFVWGNRGRVSDIRQVVQLNHVTLPAADYAASCAFYRALGLVQIVAAPPRYARFEMAGGATLSIEVMAGDNRPGSAEIYLHCDDVDAEVAAAMANGIVFDTAPRDETYLWRRAGTTDPAGNRIFLYHAGVNQRFPPWRLAPEGTPPHRPRD